MSSDQYGLIESGTNEWLLDGDEVLRFETPQEAQQFADQYSNLSLYTPRLISEE